MKHLLTNAGRRVLNTYTLLFLQSVAQELVRSGRGTEASYDLDTITYRALHTHHLGQFVGAKWNLLDVMLWTPFQPQRRERKAGTGLVETWETEGESDALRERAVGRGLVPQSPGLYKIGGTTVEGIMGGVFHQFVRTVLRFSFIPSRSRSFSR